MLYDELRKKNRLNTAWRKVRANAIRSPNPVTRSKALAFDVDIYRHIERIYRQLLKRRYRFQPVTGTPISREGKAPRPLVRAPLEDRVVQRVILDVIQNQPGVEAFTKHPSSFGGLPERTVRDAIEAICLSIDHGNSYVIKSDIRGFFQAVDRQEAIEKLLHHLPDRSLASILTEATNVEFANLEELGTKIKYYPGDEFGVAQGSALSPLLGNVFLTEFDNLMLNEGVECIRWIDDFAILADSHSKGWSAFSTAVEYLDDHGMSVYDPRTDPEKATYGPTSRAFDFLGCSISDERVLPSRKAKRRLLERIMGDFAQSKQAMFASDYSDLKSYPLSLVGTLQLVSERVRAWTNTYAFCNTQGLRELDEDIDALISDYIGTYSDRRRRLNKSKRRRLLGVWSVLDRKDEASTIYPLSR